MIMPTQFTFSISSVTYVTDILIRGPYAVQVTTENFMLMRSHFEDGSILLRKNVLFYHALSDGVYNIENELYWRRCLLQIKVSSGKRELRMESCWWLKEKRCPSAKCLLQHVVLPLVRSHLIVLLEDIVKSLGILWRVIYSLNVLLLGPLSSLCSMDFFSICRVVAVHSEFPRACRVV